MSDEPQENPALRNPFERLPRLSKGFGFLLVGGYLATIFYPDSYLIFALIPDNFYARYYFWNWFTAGFLEDSFLNVIFNGLAVVLIGKTLEPIIGSKEFCRFIILVNLLSGFATLMTYSLLYLITGSSAFMLCDASGFIGNVSGMCVFFKQLMPEQSTNLFLVFSVKAKNLPGILILLMGFFALLGAWENLPLVIYGTYFGWFYLRFIQKKADGSIGDPTPSFTFASFFPAIFLPLIEPLSGCTYSLFGRFLPSPRGGYARVPV